MSGFHVATWLTWLYLRACMCAALVKVFLWDHWHDQLVGLWPF